jgi:beta-glucanase (GH16 family)
VARHFLFFILSSFVVLAVDPACAVRKSESWSPVMEWSAGQPFDKSQWTFETGFQRNEEQQYYGGDAASNFQVTDDGLKLVARGEHVANADYRKGAGNWRQARAEARYTSASLVSKKAWQNVKIEIVANVKGGKGAWPAIWLKGENTRGFGEVDVMEQLGREPDLVHSTVHFGSSLNSRITKTADRTITGLQGKDVTYTAELTPDKVLVSVDGEPMIAMDRASGLQQPFNLIINLALGAAWAGPIDDAALPAAMTIKSIRVSEWQPDDKKEEVTATD